MESGNYKLAWLRIWIRRMFEKKCEYCGTHVQEPPYHHCGGLPSGPREASYVFPYEVKSPRKPPPRRVGRKR